MSPNDSAASRETERGATALTVGLGAGRELDALVAERYMGFRREGQPRDYDGQFADEPVLMRPGETWESLARVGYYPPPKGRLALTYFVPNYSTTVPCALDVLARLHAEARWPEMQFGPTEPNGDVLWRVSLVNPADVEVFAETLPLAICRAALSAVSSAPAGRTPE